MMRVIVGTPPVGETAKKNLEEKVLGSPRRPLASGGGQARPDYFLQDSFSSPTEDLEWEKLSIEELLAMASTEALFGDTQSFRLQGALSGGRSEEFFDVAKELAQSSHTFIFTEEKLLKKATDTLAKAGAEVTIYPAQKKEESFNMFALTYAFAARDRKKLWLLLNSALRAGAVPEAVAGMLHWKVRDILGKGEKGKFTREELSKISGELVTLYHDSHRGAGDLSLLLERYILAL
jgi:DNA polymerase III delta subunit